MKQISQIYSEKSGDGWLVVDPALTVNGGPNYMPRMNDEVRQWCFEAQISFKISVNHAKIEYKEIDWLSMSHVVQLHFPHKKDMILFKLRWGGYIPLPEPEKPQT